MDNQACLDREVLCGNLQHRFKKTLYNNNGKNLSIRQFIYHESNISLVSLITLLLTWYLTVIQKISHLNQHFTYKRVYLHIFLYSDLHYTFYQRLNAYHYLYQITKTHLYCIKNTLLCASNFTANFLADFIAFVES